MRLLASTLAIGGLAMALPLIAAPHAEAGPQLPITHLAAPQPATPEPAAPQARVIQADWDGYHRDWHHHWRHEYRDGYERHWHRRDYPPPPPPYGYYYAPPVQGGYVYGYTYGY